MLFFEIQVVNWKVRNYWITCCLASQHPSIHCYRKIVVHISVMNRHNILGIINDYYVCPHLTGKHTKLAIQQHKSIIRVQKMLTDCRFHSWSSIMKSMPNWYQYIASALNLIHICLLASINSLPTVRSRIMKCSLVVNTDYRSKNGLK